VLGSAPIVLTAFALQFTLFVMDGGNVAVQLALGNPRLGNAGQGKANSDQGGKQLAVHGATPSLGRQTSLPNTMKLPLKT